MTERSRCYHAYTASRGIAITNALADGRCVREEKLALTINGIPESFSGELGVHIHTENISHYMYIIRHTHHVCLKSNNY